METKPRVRPAAQDAAIRSGNFDEVDLGFTLAQAREEASRCLQCKKPGCVGACPVSVKIPRFIKEIADGEIRRAYDTILEDSSLPAVCSRVCPQERQCEGSCVLGKISDSIAIGHLERFAADYCEDKQVRTDALPAAPDSPAGFRVAVVGSGPASLACAADLAKAGCDVTVFEALHKVGGVLAYGIPEFRLPKDTVLEREIRKVEALGVKFETNVVVGRTVLVDELFDKEGFKAVFIGTGAGLPKFMGIPGENLCGVFSANEFLTRSNLMKAWREDYATPLHIGRRVCVVGGGNVAMDAARTALRLGAEVTVVYRRTMAELPARREEVKHASEEGIQFRMLTNPVRITGNEKGWVTGLECVGMELGEKDASGRRSPVPIDGSSFTIECDTVIMALGTLPNKLLSETTPGIETDSRGTLVALPDGSTTRPGVFAGGDAVTGAATVILAMGAGRKAAASIVRYLESLHDKIE